MVTRSNQEEPQTMKYRSAGRSLLIMLAVLGIAGRPGAYAEESGNVGQAPRDDRLAVGQTLPESERRSPPEDTSYILGGEKTFRILGDDALYLLTAPLS